MSAVSPAVRPDPKPRAEHGAKNADEALALDALRRHGGVARSGQLASEGMRPAALLGLWRRGQLLRLKAGLYQLPEALADEHAAIVQAALAVPRGVICLLSALDVYGLTDANPERVFVALPQGSWIPRVDPNRRSRSCSTAGGCSRSGVRRESSAGAPVALFSREKTLCDCFRLPELVGLDLALSALRRYLRSPGGRRLRPAGDGRAVPGGAAHAPLCGGHDCLNSDDAGVGHRREPEEAEAKPPAARAASVRDRLLNLSRRPGQRAAYNALLRRYLQERLLWRLALSEHRDRFVLKGRPAARGGRLHLGAGDQRH